jgi:phage I-like protein
MADDVSRVLGRLEAGVEAIIDRVNRSDDATAQKFRELAAQHERDKQAAIAARAAKEARDDVKHNVNVGRLDSICGKVDGLSAEVTRNTDWIDAEGRPLVGRVETLEDEKKEAAAESRGRKAVFGIIYAAIGAALTALGALGSDFISTIRSMVHGG